MRAGGSRAAAGRACLQSCPAGYTCNSMGVCAGGNQSGIVLNVQQPGAVMVSGLVRLEVDELRRRLGARCSYRVDGHGPCRFAREFPSLLPRTTRLSSAVTGAGSGARPDQAEARVSE